LKKYLFTTQEDMEDKGLKELKNLDSSVKFFEWVDSGIGVIDSDETIILRIKESYPIFVRHIHPVDDILCMSNNEGDIEILKEYVEKNMEKLNFGDTFSVQTRLLKGGKWNYTKYVVNSSMSKFLEDKKFVQDTKKPKQILSITMKKDKAYVGISKAKDNISNWTGGEHRFKVEDDQISRSEFKLLEAIDCFNINTEKIKIALDINFGQGGWTKVLLSYGMLVDSIDSAELDKELVKNNRLKHYSMSIGQFVKKDYNVSYDLIVNDMKMDSVKSSEHMKSVGKYLSDNGIVIMTLKLPKGNFSKTLNDAIKSIKEVYTISRIKQLFNNRSEVTLMLRKIKGNKESDNIEMKTVKSKPLVRKVEERGNTGNESESRFSEQKRTAKRESRRVSGTGKKLATRPVSKEVRKSSNTGFKGKTEDRKSVNDIENKKEGFKGKKEYKKPFGDKKDGGKSFGPKRKETGRPSSKGTKKPEYKGKRV